jgi:Skp family chaperone for outer membrane proteins
LTFTDFTLPGTIPPRICPPAATWNAVEQIGSGAIAGHGRPTVDSKERSAVKKSLLAATVVATLVTFSLVSESSAQVGGMGRPAGGAVGSQGIALIDIGYIFKNHIKFKNAMDGLGKDIKVAEDTLNKEREVIQKMITRLKDYKPGTPDYKHLEEDVTQKQADFTVRAQIQKREFQEREAKVYLLTVQEINDTVKAYSDSQGLTLVMKFNGDPMDPNDRESIMRELNKPIMYYRPGIDITPVVLDQLNRGQAPLIGTKPAGPGTGPGAGPGAGLGAPPRQPLR